MATKKPQLAFAEVTLTGTKTKTWRVACGIHPLGVVRYFTHWRKYVFETSGAIFDESCLDQIIYFLRIENEKRKEELRKRK